MRHGQVSYFPASGKRVDPDGVSLTDEGEEQARLAGKVLAEVPFDRAVHSGLNRTRQTAELVVGERPVPLSSVEGLYELRADHTRLASEGNLERAFALAFVQARDPEARFLAGERFVDALQRVTQAWQALLDADDWSTLLVVAHGGVNRMLIAHALGAGPASYGSLEQEAGCINVVDVDPPDEWYPQGRHIVRMVNYSPYDDVKRGYSLTTMERLWQGFANLGKR